MIIVLGSVIVKDGRIDEALEISQQHVNRSRNEPGCIAKASFIIADFDNGVKEQYVDWVRNVVAMLKPYGEDDRVNISIAGEPYFLAWMMVQLIDHWYLFVASILIAFLNNCALDLIFPFHGRLDF